MLFSLSLFSFFFSNRTSREEEPVLGSWKITLWNKYAGRSCKQRGSAFTCFFVFFCVYLFWKCCYSQQQSTKRHNSHMVLPRYGPTVLVAEVCCHGVGPAHASHDSSSSRCFKCTMVSLYVPRCCFIRGERTGTPVSETHQVCGWCPSCSTAVWSGSACHSSWRGDSFGAPTAGRRGPSLRFWKCLMETQKIWHFSGARRKIYEITYDGMWRATLVFLLYALF